MLTRKRSLQPHCVRRVDESIPNLGCQQIPLGTSLTWSEIRAAANPSRTVPQDAAKPSVSWQFRSRTAAATGVQRVDARLKTLRQPLAKALPSSAPIWRRTTERHSNSRKRFIPAARVQRTRRGVGSPAALRLDRRLSLSFRPPPPIERRSLVDCMRCSPANTES